MSLILLLACTSGETTQPADADGDGYAATDCDDSSAAAFPGGTEVCDGIDNDCNGEIDDAPEDGTLLYRDSDGDGYGDPSTAATFCTAEDGWVADFQDCDDTSAEAFPGSDEVCDGIDNDCDNQIDDADENLVSGDWTFDSDGDGYGGDLQPSRCTYVEGYVLEGGDCDDTDPALSPVADEVCDGIDNDCDGLVDAEDDSAVDASWWYPDLDEDGYGDAEEGIFSCEDIDGRINTGGDCDDTDPALSPGAEEVFGDSDDNNCNGLADELLLDSWMEGTAAGGLTGAAVAGGGDIDGDGYDDILIGAPGDDVEGEDAGAIWLVRGADRPQQLSDAAVRIYGERSGDQAGAAVDWAGDLDGDGLPDAIIGAPDTDDQGQAYLLLSSGALDPLADSLELQHADAVLIGESDGDQAGSAVAGAGDVNDDGYDDVIIGAPARFRYGKYAGIAYVMHGGDIEDRDLDDADASVIGASEEEVGHAVDGAGDINGDGYADLIIGAPSQSSDSYAAGVAYLYLSPISGTTELGDADVWSAGESALDRMGDAVAGAGDVNGDGYADVIIGAPDDDNGNVDGGSAWLIYGNATISGERIGNARLLGTSYIAHAGAAVAGPGDVDGDGRDDLLVGAPYRDIGDVEDAGAAWLVYGGGLSGTEHLEDIGQLIISSDTPGIGAAVSGGDFNADGAIDLLFGATGYGESGGAAVVFVPQQI